VSNAVASVVQGFTRPDDLTRASRRTSITTAFPVRPVHPVVRPTVCFRQWRRFIRSRATRRRRRVPVAGKRIDRTQIRSTFARSSKQNNALNRLVSKRCRLFVPDAFKCFELMACRRRRTDGNRTVVQINLERPNASSSPIRLAHLKRRCIPVLGFRARWNGALRNPVVARLNYARRRPPRNTAEAPRERAPYPSRPSGNLEAWASSYIVSCLSKLNNTWQKSRYDVLRHFQYLFVCHTSRRDRCQMPIAETEKSRFSSIISHFFRNRFHFFPPQITLFILFKIENRNIKSLISVDYVSLRPYQKLIRLDLQGVSPPRVVRAFPSVCR